MTRKVVPSRLASSRPRRRATSGNDLPPDGEGAGERGSALFRQHDDALATVGPRFAEFEIAVPFERPQNPRHGRRVHHECARELPTVKSGFNLM